VRQKLKRFSLVQLHRFVRAFKNVKELGSKFLTHCWSTTQVCVVVSGI